MDELKPSPDSQFRLRPCKCGSEDVVYQSYQGPSGVIYRVKCRSFGFRTIFGIPVKPVDSDGYGIYISGGKIPIRILNPDSDRTVYLFDEQHKKEVCVDV